MKDRELKSIALNFRRGLLKNRSADQMCMVVCAGLQGYLSFLGVTSILEEVDFGQTNHVWLRLPDGRILDPTADQFNGKILKFPKVYLGLMPPIYQRWINAGLSGA